MNHIFSSLFYVQYFHWLKKHLWFKDIYACICICIYMWMPIHVCMYVCVYIYMYVLKHKATHEWCSHCVICVNITMSCLYQIVPYMCSMHPPLSVDNKKKFAHCKWRFVNRHRTVVYLRLKACVRCLDQLLDFHFDVICFSQHFTYVALLTTLIAIGTNGVTLKEDEQSIHLSSLVGQSGILKSQNLIILTNESFNIIPELLTSLRFM